MDFDRIRTGIVLACAGLVLGSACSKDAPPAPAAAPPTMLQWNTNAQQFRGRNGQMVTVLCPPNGVPGSVWGSDLYSDDSSVCTAALHSGRVTLATGGLVLIQIAPGAPAYAATLRNGVTSRPWGSWSGSFTIVGGPLAGLQTKPADVAAPAAAPAADVRTISWSTQGLAVVRNGSSSVVSCPPGGRARSVWGTDTYSSDSSICTAAVHAGLITFDAGGVVEVAGVGGLGHYEPSRRNGVRSQSWGSWGASFRLAAAALGPYVCFQVTFPDGTHNSECVHGAEHCLRDLADMTSHNAAATFQGCEATPTVYCYTPNARPLCFATMADCTASQAIIPGGACAEAH